MTDNTYNGWTNYETWAWALWDDSDYWRERAKELLAEVGDVDVTTYLLSQEMQDQAEDNGPDLENGPYADILGAAMSNIDWYEIAEHAVDDAA